MKYTVLDRLKKLLKIILGFLISLIGILLLVFIFINLPFSNSFVTKTTNKILNRVGLPMQVESVRRITPKSVTIEGVLFSDNNNDSIIYAGKVNADYNAFALLRKRVNIQRVNASNAGVSVSRNNKTGEYIIVELFSRFINRGDEQPMGKGKSWKISISNAVVEEVTFRMEDMNLGININQEIHQVKTDKFDISLLDKTIIAKSIWIEVARGYMKSTPGLPGQNGSKGSSWSYGVTNLSLSEINFDYYGEREKMLLNLSLEEGKIKITDFDLEKKLFDIDRISLAGTDLILVRDTSAKAAGPTDGIKNTMFPFTIRSGEIDIEDSSFKQERINDTPGSRVMQVTNLQVKLADLILSEENTGADIKKLNFDIDTTSTAWMVEGTLDSRVGLTEAWLKIETGKSHLNFNGNAGMNLWDIIREPSETGRANITITNTAISPCDLLWFYPYNDTTPLFRAIGDEPVNLGGSIQLDNENIKVEDFSISRENNFSAYINGHVNNSFDMANANGEMNIDIPVISPEWLIEALSEAGIERTLPEFRDLSIYAVISKSITKPEFDINIRSDLGIVSASGIIDLNNETFSANSVFENISVGQLAGNEELGLFYGSGRVEGAGFKPGTLTSSISIQVDSLSYRDYNYTNTKIEGNIEPGNYSLVLNVDDPSLIMDIKTDISSSGEELSIIINSSLYAQLKNLNLYKDTLFIESVLAASFKEKPDSIVAGFSMSETEITNPEQRVHFGKIRGTLSSDTASTIFMGESDFMHISVQIENPFHELGSVFNGFKKYFASFVDPENYEVEERISHLPVLKASLGISDDNIVEVLKGDTTFSFEKIDLTLVNETGADRFNLSATSRSLRYDSIFIGDLKASIIDSAGIMNTEVIGTGCSIFSSGIDNLLLSSSFTRGKGLTSFNAYGREGEIKYAVQVSSEIDSSSIIFNVPLKKVTLNGEEWNLDREKIFILTPSLHAFSSELIFTSGNSEVNLVALKREETQTYNCTLENLRIPTSIIDDFTTGNPAGILSGSVSYSNDITKAKKIAADLHISDAVWSDVKFNNVTFTGNYFSGQPEAYTLDMTARFDASSVTLKGDKQTGENRTIRSEFNSIPIKTFQPFISEYVSDLSGNISGSFNISSVNDVEAFSGEVDINEAGVNIISLNSKYRIPGEKVLIKSKSMVFDNFRIIDALDNPLMVNGSVSIDMNRAIRTDLEISSLKLQVLNTGSETNSPFYGKIYVDSRLSLKGSLGKPVLKGRIILSEGTNVFYRNLEDLTMSETLQIVEFTDFSNPEPEDRVIRPTSQLITNNSSIETVVEINSATKINFNLNKKIYGIDLMIKGGGILNFNMLSNNQVNLAGEYAISEGTAELKIVGWPNKSFRISEGGFIRWDGILENPSLNFEAVNRVRSSYKNPVDGQQREVDLFVTLKLYNQLSNLDVLFTINTPDQYLMSIINTLSPEEQMRQAITILLFEKIDLPGISTSNDYITEQVNQLVASQLNQLTKTTIKGVDISFGIDSYVGASSTGKEETRTSLSYEVRKALLDNRGQIEVSGRLNDLNNQPGASDVSLNNVSFEYRLDSAGTKFLKVYHEQSYEDVFEGEITKAGIGFKYRKSYRKFRDIWRREKKSGKKEEEVR